MAGKISMKILFDFRAYQLFAGRGIGRYFLSLFEHIIKFDNVEAYVLVSSKLDDNLPDSIVKNAPIYVLEKFDEYAIDFKFDFFFKGNFFDLYDSAFEFNFPRNVIIKCGQVVGIIHDLIPMIFPNSYLQNKNFRKVYARNVEALRLAGYLFADSVCTRNDCVKLAGYPEKNISVIYGGADLDKFRSANSNKVYDAASRKNNIVYVAGFDVRKNFTGLSRAFAKAYASGKLPKDAKLYFVCKSSSNFIAKIENAIKDYSVKIGKNIIITDFIEDDVLVELLASARATIFPSFYEGLGLPLLESYIAGTPCFASDLSATKEFVLPECLFNPHNEDEIVQSIISIYTNEELCKKSLEFGRKLVKEINWDNAALKVVKKLEELQKLDNKKDKVAVFSTLPPDKTGIAQYSYKLHAGDMRFDIISDIKSLRNYQNLLNEEEKYVFYGRYLSYHPSNNVAFDDNSVVFSNFLNKGIASFGPYASLYSGNYMLDIDYELSEDSECEFRVVVDQGKTILLKRTFNPKSKHISIPLLLEQDKENVEVQTLFKGLKFVIKKIVFTRQPKDITKEGVSNIVPSEFADFMHLFHNYIGKIFVLGNSSHHRLSLSEAIKTKNEPNRILYLHEAAVIFTFGPIFNYDMAKIKSFFALWYPHLSEQIANLQNMGQLYDLLKANGLWGIRPLLNVTNIKHLVVNTPKAKAIIEKELTPGELNGIKIDVLYLPIPDLQNIEPINIEGKQKGSVIVGAFGIASHAKGTDTLIDAIELLNKQGNDIKLLLAGYNVKDYVANVKNNKNIIVDNEPSGDKLLSLMKSVDLAVQLRNETNGESSGSIAELLGMNQRFITTEGFVNSDLLPYCATVPVNVSAVNLAKVIKSTLNVSVKENRLCEIYSCKRLADELYNLVLSDKQGK